MLLASAIDEQGLEDQIADKELGAISSPSKIEVFNDDLAEGQQDVLDVYDYAIRLGEKGGVVL